jgi:serine kinase of HPr protein (carbohydrate metabolism regulator)
VIEKTVHATAVALDGRGVLLLGPSGAGKSDLALRLIDRGWRLVADDRVVVTASDGVALARPPVRLDGLIEVRQVGIVVEPAVRDLPLVLAIDLAGNASRRKCASAACRHRCLWRFGRFES